MARLTSLSLALLAIGVASAVRLGPCDQTAFDAIAKSSLGFECALDAGGYTALNATYPTNDQLPQVCSSSACASLLTALKTTNPAAPNDCYIAVAVDDPVFNLPSFMLYALNGDLLTPLESDCADLSANAN